MLQSLIVHTASRVDFKTYLKILLETKYLDWNFFYWTVERGKATLRTSNKQNRTPQKIVSILRSYPCPIPIKFERVFYDTGVEKKGFTIKLGDVAEFSISMRGETDGF
jgi:hypothetical protein